MNDIVTQAQAKAKRCQEYWQPIYDKARDDLEFLSDDPAAQWPAKDYEARVKKGRPALSLDQMTQFVNQASNDIRMNTPSINVIPHEGGADVETAEIIQGKIRDIELVSGADDAYDTAVNFSIKCSIGFIRVDHEYATEEGMEQELCIQRVINPFAVLLDDESIEPDGSDAMCGFVLEEISTDEFKRRWPDKNPESFLSEHKKDNSVLICEYFKVVEDTEKVGVREDGVREPEQEGVKYKASREIKKRKVMRYKLSGTDLLEEGPFPGKYVPIVPVYGEEAWKDGKRELHSLIRKAKDAQRMYNFWKSTEAELLMKQPKAQWLASTGATEQHADDWLHPDKAMVLRFNTHDAEGRPVPAPREIMPPQIPAGIVNASREAVEDIKSTMGLFNAWLGQKSNETSGVAIKARKQEGDRAIYHYGDNLVRSITHVGRILVSAMPAIYDNARLIRIVDKEENSKLVGVNGAMGKEQKRPFDLKKGEYMVRVITGGSYATQRQEQAEFLQNLVQAQPEMMKVVGDLMFQSLDLPGAPAVADRLKKLIPPELLEKDGEEQDPKVMALMQENQQMQQTLQAMQQQLAQAAQQLESKEGELAVKVQSEAAKAENNRAEMALEVARLQMEKEQMQRDYDLKLRELALNEKELKLNALEAVKGLVQPQAVTLEAPQ